jgi:hypothetical protein
MAAVGEQASRRVRRPLPTGMLRHRIVPAGIDCSHLSEPVRIKPSGTDGSGPDQVATTKPSYPLLATSAHCRAYAGNPAASGMKTCGLPGMLAPTYQDLQPR